MNNKYHCKHQQNLQIHTKDWGKPSVLYLGHRKGDIILSHRTVQIVR